MTVLKLDLKSSAWALAAAGAWQGRCDRKGVYVMRHPYEPAQEGVCCRIAQRVSLPEAVADGGSVWLRFYCSDGYVGCDRRNPEVGYDAENDPGCRFRRVRIDGHAVWEADVAGPNPPSSERFYACDITSRVNGPEVEVAFETADTRSTTNRFATAVYWALPELVVCGPGEAPGAWGTDAVAKPDLVAPPAIPAEPVGCASVPISVPNGLHSALSGLPVTSGIPFPQGHLAADGNVRLIAAEGRETPLQTETLCRWPDGSVRWLLLDFQTGEGENAYRLEYGTDVHASAQAAGIAVAKNGDGIAVDTGRLKAVFSMQSSAILERLTAGVVDVVFEHPLLSLENYYGFPPARYGNRPPDLLEVETAGPLRTVIKAEGHYEALAGEAEGLTYILRFHFYAGRADIKVEHTFVNATSPAAGSPGVAEPARRSATLQIPATALRTVSVHLPAPGKDGLRYASAADAVALAGELDALYEVRLIQSAPGICRLFECPSNGAAGDRERMADAVLKAQGTHAAGWVDLSASAAGLTVAVRDCWQQYPKAFRLSKRGLDVDLWTSERIPSVLGSDPPFNCMQGESKTHEIFLCLHAGGEDAVSAQAVAEAFQDRPRAETPAEWACDSLAFGPISATDPARFPAYEAAMAALDVERMGHGGGSWWHKIVTDGGEDPDTYDRYGMENWGDNPLIWGYQTKYRMWSNCEYDLAHTAFQQYLRSGDAAYFRRAEQAALHVRDVDIIHHSTVMPETVGGPHHHWIHHCVSPPNSGHVWSEGIVEHYWLTGDRRSLEVAGRLGDFLIHLVDRGSHRGAERAAGWPLIALMGIYKATLEDRYLRAAEKLVNDVVAWQDPVRGVWGTAISEQPAYEGGTTFMVVILTRGLIRYYEVTGDARAAHAVVRAANWVLDEAIQTSAGEPPQAFYKQTPHCSHISLIQPEALAYAYALTGDEAYGTVARMALRENLKRWTRGVPTATMRDMPRVLQILGGER